MDEHAAEHDDEADAEPRAWALGEPARVRLRGTLAAYSAAELRERAEALGVHPVVVGLMVGRGVVSLEQQRGFLAPRLRDLSLPTEMAGFAQAVELLLTARRRGWRVGMFGDYDVDGVTTTTILTTFLECLGVEIVPKVASREGGYGFGLEPAQALHEAGVDLVLTGDCGTSDHEALAWLQARDVPTIVIDHHHVPTTMPPATALINPHQAGCGFPFKGLCSAGVGFYLAAGMRSALAKAEPSSRANLPDPRAWLDLVALGTVCDMMPLVGDNRVLVRAGLEVLGQRQRPGVRELLRRARVEAEVSVDEGHLGFMLGPRLNAPGRLGSAEPSLELLRARSGAEAQALAAKVEMFNSQRRDLQERIVAEALELLAEDPKTPRRSGIVVARENWAPGIVGIAAAGIVERFARPTLVIGVDPGSGEARGSARSAGGVDVRAALEACAGLLRRFGGHKAAAGVSLDASAIPELTEQFDRACAAQLGEDAGSDPHDDHDGELALEDIDLGLIGAIESLGPFGVGFARPRYLCAGATVVGLRVLKERHLALTLRQGRHQRDAIAFRKAEFEVGRGDTVGCLFTPSRNSYRGNDRVQLIIDKIWRA
ncbi:Single-stranded-DNA-specific exonuclease RecJ [Enhygromyxa salina]|uniref:Single-stranded-DNA-specific exonuclease RecJ n=1 Tax=Enhygromyxa salina TaxID=215803 RepID=A0A0C2DET3_9BACT|nr:single-stranded-DNA-specific exonuclease RecJ [Enhygromyxa salina]KIG18172.1 Single-stranded-DNA-specific exonuclease RecJ [Enhygromyxa salina]